MRIHTTGLSFAVGAVVAALSASAAAGPGTPSKGVALPVTAAKLHGFIARYAPVVFFHPEERHLPTSAEWLLARAQRVVRDGKAGLVLRDRSPATVGGSLADAKAYVNAKVSAAYTDLQFWLLHAYNGAGTAYWKKLNWRMRYESLGDTLLTPCGEHEGDWEHVTLRVDNRSGLLTKLYLSQHSAGGWSDVGPTHPWNNGKRLELYSSKNGHALFLTADRHYYEERKAGLIEFRLVNATGRGKSLDLRRYQLIGALGPNGQPAEAALGLTVPSWRALTGRWGQIEQRSPAKILPGVLGSVAKAFPKATDWLLTKTGLKGECFEGYGPVPPWSKGSWTGAE